MDAIVAKLDALDEQALDRLINATNEFQLNKALAIADYVKWRVELFHELSLGKNGT